MKQSEGVASLSGGKRREVGVVLWIGTQKSDMTKSGISRKDTN